ncbi:MAG: DUF3131 domain-containing protein [Candidatus Omnitrophica bacterium]|nr:DUF3131 domain-containing protein [Candidatus Omnitrophota bacterium]
MKTKKYIRLFVLITFFLCVFVSASSVVCTSEDKEQNAIPFIYDESEEIGFFREAASNEKRIIIDDFDDGNLKNRLDGQSGGWNLDPNDEFTSCRPEIVSVPAPELSKKVLQLTYDIEASETAQNGYWTKLMNIDATNYDHLEFLVKGDSEKGFTSSFIVELKKFKDETRTEKLAASYIVTCVTSSWQRYSIPLNKFSAIREMKNLDELVIIFNDRLCDNKEGVLYFDTFQFRKTGHPGPSAFDFRGSALKKTTHEYDPTGWAQWLAKRLCGYPKQVYVKKEFPKDDRELLLEIAYDTWRFFDEVVDKKTHLPLDTICLTEEGVFGEGGYVGDYTNVTNIGLYLICLVAAYDFGFIDKAEVLTRINQTLGTVESLETYKHFLFNYYDTTTAERTSNFISCVDSGWLASGVYVAKNVFPENEELRNRCDALLDTWDFSFFYDDVAQQFFHGYFKNLEAYANYHYGAFYSESRIASYLAIARGDVPLEHWVRLHRTFPESYSWQQQMPINRKEKTFHDITYFGGYYEYKEQSFVPSWGGSLFEALMPALLLNEKDLAPDSLGLNNLRHAQLQASYAKDTLGYPVWGMSPSSVPEGGYSEYGVKYGGLKGYKDGVVTPHATFLTLEYIPKKAIENIRTLINLYDIYGEYGFYDAVNPKTKKVALKYLCLDQAMIFISLDNYLNDGIMRNRFHQDPVVENGEFLLRDEKLFE